MAPEERFAALRAEVARDLRPVRPVRLGRRVFAAAAVFTVVSLGFLGWYYGLRPDSRTLGPFWLWGLSVAEIAAAAVLLGLDVRHATPGLTPSRTVFFLAGAGSVVLHLAVSWWTWLRSPFPVPAGKAAEYWLFCFRVEALLAVPMLLVVLWALLRKGLVTSSGRVGLAGGLGAGLLADAVWRLICPYSELGHALGAHSGGIVAVVAGGLLLAGGWDRARLAAWRS